MREHKFRAWDKKLGGWLDLHSLLIDCNGRVIGYADDAGNNFRTLDCIELVEYTGLKDKNGKEIYEGDIVIAIDDGFEEEELYIAIVECDSPDGGFNLRELDGEYIEIFHNEGLLKVIGDIYENPELLEEK